jgi:hypothetical protein
MTVYNQEDTRSIGKSIYKRRLVVRYIILETLEV